MPWASSGSTTRQTGRPRSAWPSTTLSTPAAMLCTSRSLGIRA
ncbi:hypothetical protein [Pseudorhodoferax sp. Leaf265]|nr:hypothetical protein [Pseudorhodoferax sp. Leaf265]